ncbi:MAG: ATP-binding protein [Armatimonadota bacterium]|nr:ATP-binding protein [Armatimonadota bacterium]MCX7778053.1 ATP-binding protein [Armatimonadota bacterium]MDW8026063.1 ATP-binding protein [Armatimonadota bacterium]
MTEELRDKNSAEELRARLQELEEQLKQLQAERRRLQQQLAEMRAMEEVLPPTSEVELNRTLKRMFARFARFLQANRCLLMLHDPMSDKLMIQEPLIGFDEDDSERLKRLSEIEGEFSAAFRERRMVALNSLEGCDAPDIRMLHEMGIKSVLAVPMVWERRDEDQHVIERRPIGMLAFFDKRGDGGFITEDRRIVEVLARQAAAVIAGAQLIIQVVERKQELERAFQSMLAGVIIVNLKGRVQLINQIALSAFCSGIKDGIGKPYGEVVKHDGAKALIERALNDMAELAEDIEIAEPEERIFRGQTAVVKDENGNPTGIIAIFTDITEIRRLEQLKTHFVAAVSHELRTPLTSIKGFVATLLDDTEGYFDHQTRYEFYQIIDQECDRLRRLIDDLLNLSRIERGLALQPNWQVVDVASVVKRVLVAQQVYTDKHELVTDIPEELPPIVADEDKLDEILTNLVNNAIKYSPNGGKVIVRVIREDNTLLFSVKDQGIGIPRDKLATIFEKFARIDTRDTRAAGGTGLGLYLVKHLVEAHDGMIWAESEGVGKGSTFYFRLPIFPNRAREEKYIFPEVEKHLH